MLSPQSTGTETLKARAPLAPSDGTHATRSSGAGRRAFRINVARLLRSAVGIMLLGAAAWSIRKHVFLNVSTEAVITADLVSIATPIDGFVYHGTYSHGA